MPIVREEVAKRDAGAAGRWRRGHGPPPPRAGGERPGPRRRTAAAAAQSRSIEPRSRAAWRWASLMSISGSMAADQQVVQLPALGRGQPRERRFERTSVLHAAIRVLVAAPSGVGPLAFTAGLAGVLMPFDQAAGGEAVRDPGGVGRIRAGPGRQLAHGHAAVDLHQRRRLDHGQPALVRALRDLRGGLADERDEQAGYLAGLRRVGHGADRSARAWDARYLTYQICPWGRLFGPAARLSRELASAGAAGTFATWSESRMFARVITAQAGPQGFDKLHRPCPASSFPAPASSPGSRASTCSPAPRPARS